MQLIRNAGQMHHEDVVAFRKTGRWQRQLFGEELSERARLATARTSMLTVRVRDESVRDLAHKVSFHANEAGMCATERQSQLAILDMGAAVEKLNQRIGELLRTLDDPTPT